MALVAAYHFNEASGPALDVSGNGRDISTLTRTTGYNLSGISGATFGTLGGGTIAPFETAQRSFTFWAKPDLGQVWGMRWQVDSIDSAAWGLGVLPGGTSIMLQSRGDNGLVRALGVAPDGVSWYHYAGTYDGVNIRLYINRTLVDTQPQTGALLPADTCEFVAAGSWALDNLRVYDAVIGQAQIDRDYATPPGQVAWSAWNGSSEDPLILDGSWNGVTIDDVEYDTQA